MLRRSSLNRLFVTISVVLILLTNVLDFLALDAIPQTSSKLWFSSPPQSQSHFLSLVFSFAAAASAPVTFTVPQKLYTSEYHRVCTGIARNLTVAKAYCTSLGAGWDLGTIPNLAAHEAILGDCSSSDGTGINYQPLFTAGKRSSSSSSDWSWTAGRLTGQQFMSSGGTCSGTTSVLGSFNAYCPWNPWADISGSKDTLMAYKYSGDLPRWVNSVQSPTGLNAVGVVCERSLCSAYSDCIYANTITVEGNYYPNCVCKCKANAGGSRCETLTYNYNIATTPATPAIYKTNVQYTVDRRPIYNYNQAKAYCAGLGNGYALATAVTLQGFQALTAMAYPLPIFIGIQRSSSGPYTWTDGRMAGKSITFSGSTCSIDSTQVPCPFPAPLTGTVTDNLVKASINNDALVIANAVAESTNSADPLAFAAVCERSNCVVSLDCVGRTASVSGFYGACNCVCTAGSWGDTCELPISIDHGAYTSEFSHGCGSTDLSYDAALTACKSQSGWGNGTYWTLASMPSTTVHAQVLATINRTTGWHYFLSGTDTASEGTWKWAGGRLDGKIFYSSGGAQTYTVGSSSFNYQIFGGTQPDNSGGGEDYLVWQTNVDIWNDVAPASTNIAGNTKCFVCERSLCNKTLDCEGANTDSASGYYPYCSCICKEGAWGDHCEFPIVVSYPNVYNSQYRYECGSSTLTQDQARSRCLGSPQWFLGTIPSQAAQFALNASINRWITFTNSEPVQFITGGYLPDSTGIFRWATGGGKLDGEAFSNGANALSYYNNKFSYTNWNGGEPNNYGGSERVLVWIAKLIFNDDKMLKWNDMGATSSATITDTKCYICERITCNYLFDCESSYTASAYGYYPNCVCNCKPNYAGDKCELISVVQNNSHTSHYSITCGVSVGFPQAKSLCAARAGQWWLASVPTQAAFDLIDARATANMYLGGELISSTNWYWTTGRLNGLKFSTGNLGQTHSYNAFGVTYYFNFVKWAPGEPNGVGFAEPAYMYDRGARGLTNMRADYATSCYVCERSPCTSGIDCRDPQEVSGYFPNCVCTCKSGTWGDRCEFPIIINQSTFYTSQYDFTCLNGTWAEARQYCRDRGDGWHLATLPTAESFNILAAHLPTLDHRFMVAGSDVSNDRNWKWVEGRLTGMTFWRPNSSVTYSPYNFNFAQFEGGAPSYVSNAVYLLLRNQGGGGPYFRDYIGTEATSAQDLFRCTTCERSLCVFKTDCNETTTATVTGYWPSCQCTCKIGFWGDRCDNASVVIDHNPSYRSEYDIICFDGPRNWSDLSAQCSSRSQGPWGLASIPSATAFDKIAQALSSMRSLRVNQRFALVGRDDANEGSWVWRAGRQNNNQFFTKPNTNNTYYAPSTTALAANRYQFQYSQWHSGEPSGSGGADTNDFLFLQYRGPINGWGWVDDQNSVAYDACSLCERSPCNILADCVTNNTVSVVAGYYSTVTPCKCVCKEGFYGTYCEKSYPLVVDQGPYTSEYEPMCGRNTPSWSQAVTVCTQRGNGWHLATIPTAAAAGNITAALDSNSSSYKLGGSDATMEGNWTWASGRLAGQTFFFGSASVYTVPIYSVYGFKYTNWQSGEPNNNLGNENFLQLLMSTYPVAWLWNDVVASTASTCFICERSRCRNDTDCVKENTRVMTGDYWPSCKCFCRARWKGARCDVVATSSVTATITMTLSKSDARSGTRTLRLTPTGTALATESATTTRSVNPTETLTMSRSLLPTTTLTQKLTMTIAKKPTRSISTLTLSVELTPSRTLFASLSNSELISVSLTHLGTGSESLACSVSSTMSVSNTNNVTASLSIVASTSQSHTNTLTNPSLSKLTRSGVQSASISQSLSISESDSESMSCTLYKNPKPKPAETTVVQAASAVIVAGAIASPVGGSVSAGLALIRAAKCVGDDEVDPDEPKAPEPDLPIMVHPLRFSIGSSKVAQQQGAILGDGFIIPGILALIVGGPIAFIVKRVTKIETYDKVYQSIGFPSIIVLPFTVLAEGMGMCVVDLMIEGSPVSVLFGVLGLAVNAALIGVWGWGLFLKLPFKLLVAEFSPLIGRGPMYWLRWIVHARREWIYRSPVPKNFTRHFETEEFVHGTQLSKTTKGLSDSFSDFDEDFNPLYEMMNGMDNHSSSLETDKYKQSVDINILRFGNMISEKTFISADFFCLALSFLIGIAEGFDTPSKASCQARAAFMIIMAMIQAVLGVLAFIPLECAFNGAQLVITGIVSVVTIMTLSGSGDDSSNDALLDTLSSAISLIGMVGIVIGVVRTYSQINMAQRRQQRLGALTKAIDEQIAESNPPVALFEDSSVFSLFGDDDPDLDREMALEPFDLLDGTDRVSGEEGKAIRYTDPYLHLQEKATNDIRIEDSIPYVVNNTRKKLRKRGSWRRAGLSEAERRQIAEVLGELSDYEREREQELKVSAENNSIYNINTQT